MSVLKIVLYVILFLVLLFGAFLLYFTLTGYDPGKEEVLARKDNPGRISQDTVSMLIWNIGYAGLGDDMSFFYDGGKQVRTPKARLEDNLQGITDVLNDYEDIDFYLLQEVDVASKRSYHTDQFRRIHNHLSAHHGYFALNYRVQFIPVPLTSPLGKVTSGLATFSSHLPSRVTRYDFAGEYGWPRKLFMLERCFVALRVPVANGRELVVVNTHNSAYDQGKLKNKEMIELKQFLLSEYEKGNYLIAGGDWNQYPPSLSSNPDKAPGLDPDKTTVIPSGFMPEGWQWVYDPKTPTNRSLERPYSESSAKAVIDYYLASPNVTPLKVETRNMDFLHSDHHPVYALFRLD